MLTVLRVHSVGRLTRQHLGASIYNGNAPRASGAPGDVSSRLGLSLLDQRYGPLPSIGSSTILKDIKNIFCKGVNV